MEEAITEVNQGQSASTGGVQQQSSEQPIVTTSSAQEVDPETRYQALLSELEQTKQLRDKYRDGMLALKGKKELSELDLTDPVQLEAYITKTVEEKSLATKEAQKEQELLDFNRELLRKNKEMARIIASNSGSIRGGASAGASTQPRAEVSKPEEGYWGEENLKELKARGLTDEQIKRATTLAIRNG